MPSTKSSPPPPSGIPEELYKQQQGRHTDPLKEVAFWAGMIGLLVFMLGSGNLPIINTCALLLVIWALCYKFAINFERNTRDFIETGLAIKKIGEEVDERLRRIEDNQSLDN